MKVRSFHRNSLLSLSERKNKILIDMYGFYLSENRDKVLTNLGPHIWRCLSNGIWARYLSVCAC